MSSYCAPLARARPEAARTGGADATTAKASLGIQRQAVNAPRISLIAPPTNAQCSPATIRSGSTGFSPACAAKMPPSTATPSVAPIIRAVFTTPAAAPACAFGAADKREFVILGDEAGEVTPAGADFLSKLGVDLSRARAKRRVFCRPCVDWTERRPHIGGAVGAALANRCFELKWIERVRDSRALTITPAGRRALMEVFALSI